MLNFIAQHIMDFIAQHITEITTLLLAFVAVVGLLLSYLFRPTKIEVEKRHSDDLKKLIEQWKSEIVTLLSTKALQKNNFDDVKTDEEYSLNLSVEKEYYFDDIKNHLPSDLDLLNDWKKFKKNWYESEKKRYDFFITIKDDVSKKLELPWLQHNIDWAKNSGFETRIIENIYADLSSIMKGWRAHWLNQSYKIQKEENKYVLSCYNGGLLWSEKQDVTEKAKESYLEILKNLPQSPYVKQLRDLQKDNEHLCKEREMIEKKLNYLAFIPLLPGKCEYITWSLPGIIERIKKKLFKIRKFRGKT